MRLFLSSLAFLLLAAWLVEMWLHSHDRRRRERERERGRPWWKEPDNDDLGDH